jgi:hypothetical protein
MPKTSRPSQDLDRKAGDVLVLSSQCPLCFLFRVALSERWGRLPGGDVFPGDCVVFSETLTVMQASLTGELIHVEKNPPD